VCFLTVRDGAGSQRVRSSAASDVYKRQPSAIVVGLDRQEKGQGELSAIQELERDTNVSVVSIVKLNDIIAYLESVGDQTQLQSIVDYRKTYGSHDA